MGVADAVDATIPLEQLLGDMRAPEWLTEDPVIHLGPKLEAWLADRGADAWQLLALSVEHDRLVVDVAWRREGRRRDLRADAYALIGSFAEATTNVVQRSDGDTVVFEVATGQPDGEFAAHGHLVWSASRPPAAHVDGHLVSARTIPILPCTSIDVTIAFYEALGFSVSYRQERPNTYAALVRDDIELQFFVLKALAPEDNYSTCYVLVDDVDALYAAFTDGLRSVLGKVPGRGYPRIGPLRDMAYGVRQFVVVDPAGNHVRIGQPIDARPVLTTDDAGRLERSLEVAVTLADSKGDGEAAAKVLESAMAADPDAPASVLVRARILRADLAYREGHEADAAAWLAEARGTVLTDVERADLVDDLHRAADLESALSPPAG
jgi:catechol 2,3-dioxygenase-like lactoylglutathione lyase family enzyme